VDLFLGLSRGKMMKPIIGITSDIDKEGNYKLNYNYINVVIRAGGMPILLPTGIEADIHQLSSMLDGLLLTGGGDVDPTLFNEEPHPNLGVVSPSRDSLEITLVQKLLRSDKPILGICRGLQILNIAFDGNMYQDLQSQYEKSLLQHVQKAVRHHPSHFVQVEKDTILESIAKCSEFKVNSFHHQAVKKVRKPLIISGAASDGVIEAIESKAHRFVVGVQWHPEELSDNGDEISLRLFERFIKSCNKK